MRFMSDRDSIDSLAIEEGRRVLDADIAKFESFQKDFRDIAKMNLLMLGAIATLLNITSSQPNTRAVILVVIPFIASFFASLLGTRQTNPLVGVHQSELLEILKNEDRSDDRGKKALISTYIGCMDDNMKKKKKIERIIITSYMLTSAGIGTFFGYFVTL